MKKILVILLMVGATSFYGCSPQETGTVGTDLNAEQNSDAQTTDNSGIVNPKQDDTTGASATEITQTQVGNSKTRGETNDSKSRTTQNKVINLDSARQN